MNHATHRSHCPINFALETFGDKWSLLIVRDMVFYNKRTYGEFLESEEHIATNILADRLALLEKEGVITKTVHPHDKRKDIYLLTDKGLDLIPILLQMEVWSAHHDPKSDASSKLVTQTEKSMRRTSNRVREAVLINQAPYCE